MRISYWSSDVCSSDLFKKLLLIGVAAVSLIGAGAGAGIYFGALQAHEAKPEDKYPKLVLRSDDDAEPAAEGPGKEAPLKVGTVSVPNDRFKVDPRKYEVTYYPFAESFTTNLADGSGFLQIGISVSRSDEHTSELQSLMRNSYADFCLTKKNTTTK